MMSRTGSNGFTLVEVMVATSVLVMGVVMVYEIFFKSLDYYGFYADYLNLSGWMSEKIWEAEDCIAKTGALSSVDNRPEFKSASKNFEWDLSYWAINEEQGLYVVNLKVLAKQGVRKSRFFKSAYVVYKP